MQNLKTVKHHISSFTDQTSPLTATAWDLGDDSVICAFGPTSSNTLLTLQRRRQDQYGAVTTEKIAAWDALPPNPELEHDTIVDLHFFTDTRQSVLILEGGDIVVVQEGVRHGEATVEIVGSIDAGIAAASWSPDEELIFIVTKDATALVMTRSFESTADITLATEDLKVSDHVSVGWGKVETQFKGRGAKALRDPTIPEHVDSGTLTDADDGRITISWRGDGQYVAMNSILETDICRRVIRVYSREGTLESVSEAVDGLTSALAWKPTGQTIAGIQLMPKDGSQVVFFERNGLRHGEFDLRLPPEEAKAVARRADIQWNVDSTVLALTLLNRVQLWTTGNYHWYLKRELWFDVQPFVRWNPEKPLHLVCYNERLLHSVVYSSQYTLGAVVPPMDIGLVAVIDGKKLSLTPLRVANIPPPMSYDDIELDMAVDDIAVDSAAGLIGVLQRDRVCIYAYDYRPKSISKARLMKSISLSTGDMHNVRLELDKAATLKVLAAIPDSSTWTALEFGSDGKQIDAASAVPQNPQMLIVADTNIEGPGLTNGNTLVSQHNLPQACTDVQIWRDQSTSIAFGRTESGILHVKNDSVHLKIPGCTSYLVSQSHLIFTTAQHLLKFVHLHVGELDLPADEPEKDERCRSIERGAKIVTVMPSRYALVLQMPRGNLETIFPRALVLAGIRKHLLDHDYKKAFQICRTQRVDMNILYDYAPEQFMQDVGSFVTQIRQKEHIDLFLSSLSEEDTSMTIYKETLAGGKLSNAENTARSTADSLSKVNKICDAFLNVLTKQLPAYLQCTITAHVCKNPPDLIAGLLLVSELHRGRNEDELKSAIEHICFLADVNLLYDTALGMYELEVTLLVAQQSQKDPREYLPYLQSLQSMEERRRRFKIDNDLKRYDKALTHLHAMNEFEELIAYVRGHELYAQAIALYRHDKARLQQLMKLNADFLVSRNRYADGAIAYEYVQDFDAAYKAYQSANLWKESLATAMLVPIANSDLLQLAQQLADSLEESKDYDGAAVIYLDHLSDLITTLKMHCKAYNFSEAIRLAVLKQSRNLLEEVIDPGLVESSASMTELLAEMRTQINAQVPRLRELRQKKIEEPMAFLDAAEGEGGDIPDNLSIAPTDASTSGGTFMTRYTNRSMGTLATNVTRKTSKNRRREERKKAKGKKGTVYEEEYLVNSIARLIERLDTTSGDVASLVQGLMRRTMRERAVAVENAMIEVESLCRLHMAEVFQLDRATSQNDKPLENVYQPAGGEGVLWETINSSQQRIEPPKLQIYHRSSLIAGEA